MRRLCIKGLRQINYISTIKEIHVSLSQKHLKIVPYIFLDCSKFSVVH